MSNILDRGYSILIVSSSEQFNMIVKKIIPGGRFNKIEIVRSASAARRELLAYSYDIVIINSPLPDGMGTDFVMDIHDKKEMGIIFVVPGAVFSKISEYLVDFGIITVSKPFKDNSLELSLRLILSLQEKVRKAEKKVNKLEEKMEELRAVSRAKLILVQRGMSEEEAHEYIIRNAMNRGLSKRAIAEEIIED